MATLLIEEHPRIDPSDMQALLEIAREEGLEADQTPQTTSLKAAWWVLTLHWIADDSSHLAFDAILTTLAIKARRYFIKKGKTPPRRLDIKDRDGKIIGSIEVPSPGDHDMEASD
jgi:hypothetical protein